MIKFPVYKQPDSMDCGPACIRMISQYYGKSYSIDSIRSNAFIGRDGVSLLGISKAAENIGFHTIGGRITFKTLVKKAILPCIIHWNQEHFVVVYKIKRNRKGYKIYVADPAKGLIEYNHDEFCKHWLTTKTNNEEKGVVLLLEPTAAFYEQNDKKEKKSNRFKFLWSYLVKFKGFFAQIIL